MTDEKTNDYTRMAREKIDEEKAKHGWRAGPVSESSSCFANLDLGTLSAGRFFRTKPDPIKWLLVGSISLGKVGLVVADGGTGKGFFLLQFGVSIATKRPFLDRLYELGEPGKALLIFGEDDDLTLHHRVQGVAQSLVEFSDQKIFLEAVERNLFIMSVCGADARLVENADGNLRETQAYPDLLNLVRSIEGLRLIVLDPLSRFFGGDENSASDATFFFSLIERLAIETGATVLVSHHSNKSSGTGKESLIQHAGRGSTAFTDAVRWQMNLARVNESEWQRLGINEEEVKRYLVGRVVKKNLGPPEDYFYLKRDERGVLRLTKVQEGRYAKSDEVLELVLEQIRKDTGQGKRHTLDGFIRAFAGRFFGYGKDRLRSIISDAVDKGTINLEDGRNGQNRRVEFLALPKKV